MATVGRLAPPLALMALIFHLSAQPDLSTGLGTIDTVLRKLAHMSVYGALWFLWWRALGYGDPLPAVLVAIGYGISDEWHQTTVPGRHGSPWDVAIDALGVGLAGLAVVVADRRLRASRVPWR